jgi:hypothetical protein
MRTNVIEQAYGPLKPPKTMLMLKGDERYIFVFDDEQIPDVLRIFGRFATNAELSFTWYDAAVLSQKIRSE